MSIGINIHPRAFTAKWITNFATVDIALDDIGSSYAAVVLHSQDECDALIAAATEAKRLLAEAVPDQAARVPLDVIEDESEQQRDGEA